MRRTPEEESKKGPASVSACANESPGFSVSGASTPNELFQIINELKRLVSYSKRFH